MVGIHQAEPEFSRRVHIDGLERGEKAYELVADAGECEALARRLGLLALERLTATARLARIRAGRAVQARVHFSADVVQSCVVTLDPVPAHIEESFDLVFVPEADAPAGGTVVVLRPDEEEWELLRDGVLDVGEAVAEQLALALNPYPRGPGASLDEVLEKTQNKREAQAENPFGVLKALLDEPAPGSEDEQR